MALDGYRLGIDFGTSTTVAVLSGPSRPAQPLLFEASPLLSSAVAVAHPDVDGALLTGGDAERVVFANPGGFEANPKRRIDDGTVWLGTREVAVADLLAAVFNRVADEARRVAGAPPGEVVLTHPAAWGRARLTVLVEAASRAGLPGARLVAEPVAAAAYLTDVLGRRVPTGRCLVVYDLGAGTFDVSVVRRTASGFEVLASDGLDDVGGLDLDAAVVGHARALTADGAPAWGRLDWPRTPADQQHRHQLWRGARAAKEQLTRHPTAPLRVPLLDADLHLTREEFETLVRGPLDRTVEVTVEVLRAARVPREEVAGLFLVGGGSRVPLVATLLHRAVGIAPIATEVPELVVAEGSLHSPTRSLEPPSPPLSDVPATQPPVLPDPSPAVADAAPDSSPAVADAMLESSPAIADATLESSPAIADAAREASPAIADAALESSPAPGARRDQPDRVAPAAQSVEPRGPDTRRAAARISGGFALAALAAAQFIDADGAPAPDLLITGLGLLALPVGLLLAGAGGRRARWVLLPLAVLLALRPFVVDAGDQSNPFSHPGDLFGDRRLHLVVSPVFDLVVAGLGIAAGILCARRQGLPGWRRHLPWLLAAAATAGVPAQVLERGQPLTNWPALLPPLTGWPALLPALTGWLATALAFGLSAALLTVPARAVARKPSALRALVAAGVAAAVTATAVLVAARTTPTYSSRAIATNMLVWDIAFSPDGTKIATSGRERSDTIYLVRLWDVRTGRNTVTFNDGERYNEVDFAFDPTRSMVVTGSHNGGVRLWDADTGYESDNLRPGGGDNVAFSADGKRLAMANTRGDDELFVLDLGSNQETKVLDGRSFSSYHVAFHPKLNILAAANSNELKLVDLDNENKQEVLSRHSLDIWDIAFSADGSRLATAGSDDFVYIWDWNRRSDPIATLTNGVDGANDVALSPDGKTLALASDGRVQLWSIDDNRITVLPGHPDDTTGVAFAPDGRTLASSSRDGTIRLWPLPRPN